MQHKPGFNATRRNRKIGTAAQGHGQNNRHTIPNICTVGRKWGEILNPYVLIEREVRGQQLKFFIERNTGGCKHCCSVDDVCTILEALPVTDWAEIKCFVFRQSTKAQRILSSAWGRMYYFADLGSAGKETLYAGPIIILEAENFESKIKWKKSLSLDSAKELIKLKEDGHIIVSDGRNHVISLNENSVRSTQLYRTLLHEIGHWVDFTEKVEIPYDNDLDEYGKLLDNYFCRPSMEREAFAHRYADEKSAELRAAKIIPFPRIEKL